MENIFTLFDLVKGAYWFVYVNLKIFDLLFVFPRISTQLFLSKKKLGNGGFWQEKYELSYFKIIESNLITSS